MKNCGLLLGALLLCTQVSAQIHKSNNDSVKTSERVYTISPIVVTGSGHHQRLKDTSTPVHVLSKQDIHEQGITNFSDAITKMIPQVAVSPNSMGSFLRLNGLGNKYILILVNGQKLVGDISNNIDINRINISRIRRIEVLDGAASSLYGSDAIGGVINIITDQPTSDMISVMTDTHVSGKGKFTQSVNADIVQKSSVLTPLILMMRLIAIKLTTWNILKDRLLKRRKHLLLFLQAIIPICLISASLIHQQRNWPYMATCLFQNG